MISKFISIDDLRTKATFSLIDILTGLILLFVLTKFQPSTLSNYISTIYSYAVVLPAIFLVGIARVLALKKKVKYQFFKKNILISITLNIFILALINFFYFNEKFILKKILILLLFSVSSSLQCFSLIWFHIIKSKAVLLNLKIFLSLLRFLFVCFSVYFREFSLFLITIAIIPCLEFTFLFGHLRRFLNNENKKIHIFNHINYGISVSLIRFSYTSAKLLIERLLPGFISYLVISEQLITGVVSLYEKYFLNDWLNIKVLATINFLILFFIYLSIFIIPLNGSNFLKFIICFISLLANCFSVPLMYEQIKNSRINLITKLGYIFSLLTFALLFLNFYVLLLPKFYFFIITITPTLFMAAVCLKGK